jgi:hypothetical protein
MSEITSNIEFAHKIHEHGHHHPEPRSKRERWVEILEAVVLAVVAVLTAWSGYQAARWEAQSATNYALATRTSVRAQERLTLAGQDRLYDIVTFNGWLAAKSANDVKLAAMFEHRFRPEYLVAFTAWQKLDPFNNSTAPPGPIFMPEYLNSNSSQSAKLSEQATAYFNQGVETRENADSYVRITVFLATVLLLTALSQRFKTFGPRIAVVGVAFILLAISLYWVLAFRRA